MKIATICAIVMILMSCKSAKDIEQESFRVKMLGEETSAIEFVMRASVSIPSDPEPEDIRTIWRYVNALRGWSFTHVIFKRCLFGKAIQYDDLGLATICINKKLEAIE